MKKLGKVYFKIFPHNPITKKPLEIRMGKGKGNVDHWVYNSKIGVLLCEIQTQHYIKAFKALKAAQHRLPIKTKILYF
jgi:large subunit ribosomal protein L16